LAERERNNCERSCLIGFFFFSPFKDKKGKIKEPRRGEITIIINYYYYYYYDLREYGCA
jgi:hypothetical protein